MNGTNQLPCLPDPASKSIPQYEIILAQTVHRKAIFFFGDRSGCISRICGKEGCDQPNLWGMKSPKG
ncbi:MAG TPA: hypothetical protein PLA90_15585, partial [Candidatus Sumerlaeota bacterium]|nr:hypothetical protein [Candidatus Sumerlaeota bacterium]